jgi:hypothetical protein
MTLLAGAVTLSILLGAPPLTTKQSIKVDTKFPTVGQKTVITLEYPTDAITVIYQPDAPVARKVTLKTHGKLKVAWTPAKAGVVSLRAGKVSKDVSVKFNGNLSGNRYSKKYVPSSRLTPSRMSFF